MTFVALPFRRRLPLTQPDPGLPVLANSGAAPGQTQTPGAPAVPAPTTSTPSESPGTMPEKSSSSRIPPRWAVALVALVLVLTALLTGLGHPISIVLAALGGGGYLGVELVRLLNREL